MMSLIQKYNVPGPRYTSYPTVPYWETNTFSVPIWKDTLVNTFQKSNATEGISLYIHLPFCESLCTFCGCNKRITKNHAVEATYIAALLKEWELYCNVFKQKPIIKALHLGGGTPTFFSIHNLESFLEKLFSTAIIHANPEFSFEGHPNNTTKEHLQKLYNLGFRSVSFGVQDYNDKVQNAIHRWQPFQHVAKVTFWAKEIGYTSIGHDIIFGLPFQTLESVEDTIEKTNALLPHRLAFYSYAHTPWIKGTGQRGFDESDLPKEEIKRNLYENGKELLLNKGYIEIGMDHFALPNDDLVSATEKGKLHRNFMGYTASKTQLLIGLGVSAIGDAWGAFAQNEKKLENYYEKLQANELPVFRGHKATTEDLIIRQHILNISCKGSTTWIEKDQKFPELEEVKEKLQTMQKDGILELTENGMTVTAIGKPFLRNICMAFDLRMYRNALETQLFSMTI